MNYLNVPGLSNSGAEHWQTIWEKLFPENFTRVRQKNWFLPEKNDWVDTLSKSINNLSSPTILVAHSLGCMTVAHWAKENVSSFVKGALLVAPADTEKSNQECFKSFCPVPLGKLPFPSIVVASTNDPYASMERSARWAAYWGSKFICVGDKGHINAQSGLNDWEEGQGFLKLFTEVEEHTDYKYAI